MSLNNLLVFDALVVVMLVLASLDDHLDDHHLAVVYVLVVDLCEYDMIMIL